MKIKLLLLALIFILKNSAHAQNCGTPMTQAVFQTGFNQVAIQPDNNSKLIAANNLLNNSCMLSSQVKQMSQLFNADEPRYNYCKAAYTHVYDPANFYDVYDAFQKFSWAIRLYDFVKSSVVEPPHTNTEPVFPNINYPAYFGYKGKKGCQGPVISENDFLAIAKTVFIQPNDQAKFSAAQNAGATRCLSMAMDMKLASLMGNEALKLSLMQSLFPVVHDQEVYDAARQIFSADAVKNDWSTWAKNYLTPAPPPCLVPEPEFKSLMKDIESKSFSADKMKMFETIKKDRCFSTEQVKTISKQFSFGADKLKVFKACYGTCTDRNNYSKLVDELSFSSEKEDLKNYIKNN